MNEDKLKEMAGITKIYYVEDYKNEDNPFTDKIEIQKIR